MRLKRTLNRRVDEKEYHKWVIADVPPDTVQALGWEEGEELEAVQQKGGLLVRQANRQPGKVAVRERRK